MKIYRIDVSKKNDDFNSMYDILDNIGSYLVYSGNIILLTDEEKDIKSLLALKGVSTFEILDIEKDIEKSYVKTWVKQQIIKLEFDKAQEEINERTNTLYDIIVEAKKKLKEMEEEQLKDGKSKNTDK
jgi:hypothetical protein